MKIIKKILFILNIILLLPSCSINKNKLFIDSTSYNITESIEIETRDLNSMIYINDEDINNKSLNNFILYIYTLGCTGCSYFENNILNNYIKDNQVIIYKIDTDKIDSLININNKVNPRLILFKEGKIFKDFDSNLNNDIFTDKNKFDKLMNKYVKVSDMIKINDVNQLDNLYKKDKFVIYFGWSKCGDCSYLESNYLFDKLKSNNYDKFYYFDTDYYRSQKNNNIDVWNDFVNKYKFNLNNNGGKVPTFLYIENGKIIDYIIYLNDIMTVNDDGSVTISKSSYLTDESYTNKTYSSYLEYQNASKDFHNKKLNTFMQKYL